LLGFPSYEHYFECMILLGFVGREHNRSGKPYFIKKTFEDAANNKVICWQYGTDKKPHLSIGKKKPATGKKEGNFKLRNDHDSSSTSEPATDSSTTLHNDSLSDLMSSLTIKMSDVSVQTVHDIDFQPALLSLDERELHMGMSLFHDVEVGSSLLELKMPIYRQLDRPPPRRATCPEGMTYRKINVHDDDTTVLHYYVTKGWTLATHKQKGTKTQAAIKFVYPIPIRKSLVNTSQATIMDTRMIGLGRRSDEIDKKLSVCKFQYEPFSHQLLAGMVALMPRTSSLSWEQIIPMVYGALLHDVGEHDMTAEQLANMSPSRETMENLVFEFAVESCMLTRDAFEKSTIVYTAFDKADSAKEKMGGCVKLGAAFDTQQVSDDYPDGEVIVAVLDADKSGDSSKEVAESIVHSFKKFKLKDAVLCSLTTDSGGGGAIESVTVPLVAMGLLSPSDHLVGNCALYTINLELAVGMKQYLMGASKDNKKRQQQKTWLGMSNS
jgi:hypothetical protein